MANIDLKYVRYESLRLSIKYLKNKKQNPKKLKKVADIIHNYLLKDFKDSSQDVEVHHEQIITKKDLLSKETIQWQKDLRKTLKQAVKLNEKFEKSVEKVKQKLNELPQK